MHEVSIALAIVDEITERASLDGAEKITAVYLRVGKLTAVDEHALQFAWELVTDGTLASKSRLEIESVALAIFCSRCNEERVVEGLLPICNTCGLSSEQILRGRELSITAMEVLDDSENRGSSTEHSSKEQYLRS